MHMHMHCLCTACALPVHCLCQVGPHYAPPTPSPALARTRYDLNVLPWNIAAWPTEPILKPTRRLIPPVAGVDISPIVWVAFLSFLSEILIGPQGLLSILQKQG